MTLYAASSSWYLPPTNHEGGVRWGQCRARRQSDAELVVGSDGGGCDM